MEKKESKLKSFFENFSRPFKALTDNNDDEKEIEEEVLMIEKEQEKLEIEKDYISNIKQIKPELKQSNNIKTKNKKKVASKSRKKDIELDM